MAFGLTNTGFSAKTLKDILGDVVARQRTIDPTIQTGAQDLIGQLNAVMAAPIVELWEVAQACYDALDAAKVTGAQQDSLYALTGSKRRKSQRSTVTCNVGTSGGPPIPVGEAIVSVAGNPNAKFRNTEVITGASWQRVVFESLVIGAVPANSGTLTVIESGQANWTSCTNDFNATLGFSYEPDTVFRVRRETELASRAVGTLAGLRAKVQQLPGVNACEVTENVTDNIVDGASSRSFQVVVDANAVGIDDLIAQTIWENKPAGMRSVGGVARTVVDEDGVPHRIEFSYANSIVLYVYIRIRKDSARYPGDDALKTAIINSTIDNNNPAFLGISRNVYAGRFVQVALGIDGVINAEARVAWTIDAPGPYFGFAFDYGWNLASSTVTVTTGDIARVVGNLIAITPMT